MGGWVKPKVKTFRFYRVSDSNRVKGSRRRVGCEVWAEGEGEGEGKDGFSSLVKQNKKGKKCAVFCFAGKRKLLFIYL